MVVRINLLPHREAAKKARKESFIAASVLSALVGVLIAGGIYLVFQSLLADQRSANELVRLENERLKEQIKDVAAIEAEIAALKARQEAVENLQSERNLPVQLLNSILTDTPSGAYVLSLKQSGKTVGLTGQAQSNQTVADLLENISEQSLWDTKPQLIESKAASIALANKQQRRVFQYSLNFQLNKPAVEAGESSAAAASR